MFILFYITRSVFPRFYPIPLKISACLCASDDFGEALDEWAEGLEVGGVQGPANLINHRIQRRLPNVHRIKIHNHARSDAIRIRQIVHIVISAEFVYQRLFLLIFQIVTESIFYAGESAFIQCRHGPFIHSRNIGIAGFNLLCQPILYSVDHLIKRRQSIPIPLFEFLCPHFSESQISSPGT